MLRPKIEEEADVVDEGELELEVANDVANENEVEKVKEGVKEVPELKGVNDGALV